MYVKNLSQLTPNNIQEESLALRKIGLNALEIALKSVEPKNLIQDAVKIVKDKLIIRNDKFDLRKFRKILVVGGGKASAQMALAIEEILRKYSKINYNGLINIPNSLKVKGYDVSNKIKMNLASHPIPDENGLNGTKVMFKHIENTTKDDLIIFLLSGGGSALLPLPKETITLAELQVTNALLLASGASIHEINTVRKHLSDVKGGKFAKKVYDSSKATVIALIISDVVGNNLESIASGPTIPDLTTFKESYSVLEKYELLFKVPSSVKQLIQRGMNDPTINKPLDQLNYFKKIHNYLIGSVDSSVKEASDYLKGLNFAVDYFSNEIVGEAAVFGTELYDFISHKLPPYVEKSKNQKVALIGTGELTVTIKGKGIGGRNQEMLLTFLNDIKNKNIDYNILIIGVNLDGIEGNSKAMGALVDNVLLTQIIKNKINLESYLKNNDSNSFFKMLNSEIITEATGINVNDLLLILIDLNV
ncbi:MAG: glycerate kinase type-2 family protein [Promethearchaeota archaeon]